MTEIEFQRAMENALKNMGMGRGGGGSVGSGGGTGGSVDLDKELRMLSTSAKDVDANIKKLSRQFLPFSGSLATASRLHSQMARDLDTINNALEDLEQKLDSTRDGFEKISPATKAAMQEEQKKLKAMKATVEFETQKRESVGNVFGALGNISNAYQDIARAAVQGMESISSAIQQGGSGFNLLGAAAEHQANMAQAQANMGASAMASVGQSMQGLGLAGQVAGGALNFLAQQVQHNAELRRAAARIRNQLFMNMGEKFSQSFMAAAGAGAVFAGGATAMNAALEGSRITLAEFGELVKRNNEAFATSGMSMQALTVTIGKVSANFKKSGIDTQLMKLGLSFEQQSDIIAQSNSEINKMSLASKGRNATDDELQKAALSSAKNTAFMAQIMGEEAKTRAKANERATEELAYQQFQTDMAKKFGDEYARNMTKGLNMLEPKTREIMNHVIANNGQIVDTSYAAAAKQIPALNSLIQDMRGAAMAGRLDPKEVARIQAKHREAIMAQVQAQKALGKAAVIPGIDAIIKDMAGIMAAVSKDAQNYTKEKVEAALNTVEDPKGDKPAPKDPLGDAIVNAAVTMNNFQKDMEKYVVNNLPAWSTAMQSALKDMKDAYEGKVGGLNPLAEKFAWLTEFMQKYGLIVMLAAQAIAILMAMAKLAGAALGKLGAQGEMAKLKAITDKKKPDLTETVGKDGKTRYHNKETGRFASKEDIESYKADKTDQMKAPGGKGKGLLSKVGGLAKLAGGAMAVFNVAETAMSAYSTQQEKQAEYEAAKAEGDKKGMAEARAAQGEAVGGAVGSVAGGAIGLALGGPIGAAVGSYLGEMAGGALGKYIGPYWDSMSEKAGQMWDSTKKAVSAGWDSFTTGFSNVMSSMWKGIKEGWQWMKDMFSTIGKAIWNAIQQTPLFKLGSFIISGVTGAASGMATAMINGLKGAFDWMKTTIGNLIPDWMKNAASKVGNAVTAAYEYVTGPSPKPAAQQPAMPAPASKPSPGTAKPATAPEVTLTDKQISDFAYSIFIGKNSINDVPAKYRDQVSRLVKNPPAAWKPASPQTPSATTGKTVPPDARKTEAAPAAKPGDSKPAAPTPTGPKAPETSAKSGTVSEKDIPRLLQENLKMAEYNAKGTERMVSILASIADNAKRTATATEKSARG